MRYPEPDTLREQARALRREALAGIASTTLANLQAFAETGRALHEVRA